MFRLRSDERSWETRQRQFTWCACPSGIQVTPVKDLRARVRPRAKLTGPAHSSDEVFLTHAARALWAASGMLALVALWALFVPAEPLPFERSWSHAMHELQTPSLTHLALVFNWLGHGIGRALTITAIGLVLLRAHRWLAASAFFAAETLAPLASSLLKVLVGRTRPPDGLVHPTGASFPSGHVTYAGATCVAVVLLFATPGGHRRWWWTLASTVVVGMAWSRTYLQVHWLMDVVAGALLGSGVSLFVFAVAQLRLDRPSKARPLRPRNVGDSNGSNHAGT